MNKSRSSKLHEISESEAESESDDSVNVLAEQVKNLIECDGGKIHKNALNDDFKPLKLRPSVVHRAFNRNITSTPLAAKGYKHFFASDSSLSPIRTSEGRANYSKKDRTSLRVSESHPKNKKGKSLQVLNSINSEKNDASTEINQDKSVRNDESSKKSNFVTSETSIHDIKMSLRSSRTKKTSFQNNNLTNGTLMESINKIGNLTPKRTPITTRNSSIGNKSDNVRNNSPSPTIRNSSSRNKSNNLRNNSPSPTTIRNSSTKNTSNNIRNNSPSLTTIRNSSTGNKSNNVRNIITQKIIKTSPSPPRENLENPDENPSPDLPNDKILLSTKNKSRSSFRNLSPKSERRKSNKTPDNPKKNSISTRSSPMKKLGKITKKSFLPVPVPNDLNKGRKIERHPLQVHNTDLGIAEENGDRETNKKVRSKSVDFLKMLNFSPKSKRLSNTVSEDKIVDAGLKVSKTVSEDAVFVDKPVPKPRTKKTTEISTNTEEIFFCKPKKLHNASINTLSNHSSHSADKKNRLESFINELTKRGETNSDTSTNNSKMRLSRGAQTSRRGSSVALSKFLNRHEIETQTSHNNTPTENIGRRSSVALSKYLNRQEMQTQTSRRFSLTEDSSGSVSNYTGFIEDCNEDINIYDSLKPVNIDERFSSSLDTYGFLENSKKPWRIDDDLNLPPRNSIHLSFIKSANNIETHLETIKRLRRYSKERNVESSPISNRSDKSSLSAIEISDDSDQIANGTLVNEAVNKTESGDYIESSQNVIERNEPEDPAIEAAASKAVIEWVANVNEYRNAGDDSPCCFNDDGACPTHSPSGFEKTLVDIEKNDRPKVVKALFQTETACSEKSCSDLRIALTRVDISKTNCIETVPEDGRIEEIKDKNEGVFKVPTLKAPKTAKKTKKKETPLIEVTEASEESETEFSTSGARRSGRNRRPPKRKYFPVILIGDKRDTKYFSTFIRDSNLEDFSVVTSTSVATSSLSKKSRQQTENDQNQPNKKNSKNEEKSTRTSNSEIKGNKRGRKKKKNHADAITNDLVETNTQVENLNDQSQILGILDADDGTTPKQLEVTPIHRNVAIDGITTRKKKTKTKKSDANDLAESNARLWNDLTREGPEISAIFDYDCQVGAEKVPEVTPNHSSRKTGRSVAEGGVSTKTRKLRKKKSVANEPAKSNTQMLNDHERNGRGESEVLDIFDKNYQVDGDKEPVQTDNLSGREMNHEPSQYGKNTNPSKCISSDSGTSTLLSSIKINTKSGRISKTTAKRKANKVDVDVSSEAPAEKLQYIEQNPTFNQHLDNLKYSNSLDHANGASMVYLEIPPGEIKQKHTNRKHNLFYCVVEGKGRAYIGDEVSGIIKKSRFLIPTGLCYSIINDSRDESLLLACVRMPIS